jgi:hypothetical protein
MFIGGAEPARFLRIATSFAWDKENSMGVNFDSLDGFIQDHVRQMVKPAGLSEGEETLEALATSWLEKKKAFEEVVANNGMEEVQLFAAEEEHGGLVMTYSGSLLNIGPLVAGARRCEYAPIGLRKDVPESAVEDASVLESDFETDSVAAFRKGPVRKTSPILKIARFVKKYAPEIEEARLSEVTQALTGDFVEVNKTVVA